MAIQKELIGAERLISFTAVRPNGYVYNLQAINGMTFEVWKDTEYNTIGLQTIGDSVYFFDDVEFVECIFPVTPNTVIEDGYAYVLEEREV